MTNHPKRIQRSRKRGWRMPEHVIYVGRPTKWGNQYQISRSVTARETVEKFAFDCGTAIAFDPNIFEELRGKDLACWCRLGEWCHADVLLLAANAENPGKVFYYKRFPAWINIDLDIVRQHGLSDRLIRFAGSHSQNQLA